MAATITAMMLWGSDVAENLHVCYGDNDSVRFSLICASGTGDAASSFMASYLEWEAKKNCVTWFARVPTEANITDLTILLGFRNLKFLQMINAAIKVPLEFLTLWWKRLNLGSHIDLGETWCGYPNVSKRSA